MDGVHLVVSAVQSGGTHTSRTMMLSEVTLLLAAVPAAAAQADYKAAVIDDNSLGKDTLSGRQRAYRYLRELYALDPGALAFRALRDLWDIDKAARPLLALLCSLARDPVLRATAPTVFDAAEGAPVDAALLARAVQTRYPGSYGDGIAAKIGRNSASTWTQSGHLAGRTNKKRARVQATAPALAYALLIGHTEGLRGAQLFESEWCRVLDRRPDDLGELAVRTSQRADPDATATLLAGTVAAVRDAIKREHARLEEALKAGVAELEATPDFAAVPAETRAGIIRESRLEPVSAPDLSTPDAVLRELESRPLASWADRIAAVSQSVAHARTKLAKELEPKTVVYAPPARTVKTEAEVDAYLAEVKATVMASIAAGSPVLISR